MSWFQRATLLASLPLFLGYVYVSWRVIAALSQLTDWPRAAIKWAVAGTVTLISLLPLVLLAARIFQLKSLSLALRGGNRVLDNLLLYPFWGGLILAASLIPYLLAIDLLRFPFWTVFQTHRVAWQYWQALATVVLVAFMAIYVVSRIINDTYTLRLTERQVKVPGLPAEMSGFCIVQLSDLQADPHTNDAKMQKYIALANAQQPGLIVFCGDLVTSGTQHIEQGARMLGKLRTRYGAFGCLGDHDYWSSPQQVLQALNRNGVATVEDQVLKVPTPHGDISLTIVTNVYNRRPSPELLQRLYHQRPADAVLHVLVSHQPTDNVIQFAQSHGYHLLMAGHTHGGQIVFKPFGLTLSAALLDTRFHSGFYQLGHTLLSVTNGLGLTLVPLRYQAPAEVTALRLIAGDE